MTTLTRPTLEELIEHFGNEESLAAFKLLQLSPSLEHDALQWAENTEHGPAIDWEGWIQNVDDDGRGWSSTERRLFYIVAALVNDRPIQITYCLELMGSWQRRVLEVLVDWASGGNNKDRQGAFRVGAN